MQLNMQREGANSGEFHQTSSSDDGQFLVDLRKMMKKEVEVMVINAVHQLVVPTIEDLVRKVEKIQSAQSKLLSGGIRNCANEMTVSRERSLQLKFSDEVSLPVLTGKVLLGKTGKPMMVSLIDSTTGEVVDCEPESSAKVEMLLLDANDDDKERNWSVEDFNNRIISEDDKEKPHLAKNEAKYIHLKKGVGTLCKLKLGHGSRWMKSCKCRLAARVVDNFRGNEVKEGLTELFVVSDSRSKLYEKHHPPLPSDEVWRLENISKDGAPCQRLNKENIRTVQDFLFLHNVDPQTLQQLSNYSSYEGVLYCKPHFDQLFKMTGSLNKSFEGAPRTARIDISIEPAPVNSKILSMFAGTQDKCVSCSKKVYPIEKVAVDGNSYHKSCFKCSHGGCVISPSSYIAHEHRLYCRHHHTQLFKQKGNFSKLDKFEQPTKINGTAA